MGDIVLLLTPAPNATRCEAGGGSCGAGQPLYITDGLIHCEHHAAWPGSDEGQEAAAVAAVRAKRQQSK